MTIKDMAREKLIEFQECNCRGCDYAVETLIGTGKGCCTRTPNLANGMCVNKKRTGKKPA